MLDYGANEVAYWRWHLCCWRCQLHFDFRCQIMLCFKLTGVRSGNKMLILTRLHFHKKYHDVNSLSLRPIDAWISKLAIIGSGNGLSPGRRQAIIWTIDEILLIWPLGTNFREILIEIYISSFIKMYFKRSSAKWRPFCLNVLVVPFYSMDSSHPFSSILVLHGDPLTWKCYSHYWPFVRGIHKWSYEGSLIWSFDVISDSNKLLNR